MKRIFTAMAWGVAALTVSADDRILKTKLDYTYASRYMTHGFNVGDTPAHQSSIGLSSDKLPGFSFLLWTSLTVDRAKKANDEWDLMFFYNRLLMKDKAWAIAFSSYYDYWWYPNSKKDQHGNDFQGHKVHAGGTLPNLIPMPEGFRLVPGYNFYYWTPVTGDQFTSGAVHELPLTLGLPLPLPDAPAVPQLLDIKGTMNYNTGFNSAEKGWTHATAHITTGAPFSKLFAWHVSLDYQWTFKRTNTDDDQFWGTIGVNANF